MFVHLVEVNFDAAFPRCSEQRNHILNVVLVAGHNERVAATVVCQVQVVGDVRR